MDSGALAVAMNGIGVVGVSLLLLAFFMLQKGLATSDSPRYLLLNLAGASLFLLSVLWDWNLAAFIIEVAWIAISVYGLLKYYRKKSLGE